MAKIKVPHKNNFTIIDNGHFRDPRLSLSAIGLMDKMLSLPENWDYSVSGLSSICIECKDTINRYLRELENNGYLKREQKRKDGKFTEIEYTLLETPIPVQPYPKSSDTKKSYPINSSQLSTNKSSINELSNLSHKNPQFFCTLKRTDNGEIDENCRNCYLINSCPFRTRCPNCAEVLNPNCLSESELEYLMSQIFLYNSYYDISERLKNGNITELEKEYYCLEDD